MENRSSKNALRTWRLIILGKYVLSSQKGLISWEANQFGGKVAFEMAQQLHAQGQLVALLALIDTYGQNAKKLLPVHIRIFRHLANLLRLEPNEK